MVGAVGAIRVALSVVRWGGGVRDGVERGKRSRPQFEGFFGRGFFLVCNVILSTSTNHFTLRKTTVGVLLGNCQHKPKKNRSLQGGIGGIGGFFLGGIGHS